MRHDPARGSRGHPGSGGHGLPMLRKGVQQAGNEHVACRAAQWMQMDVLHDAYSIVGAKSCTDSTSSPSQLEFFAVPSKVALVLNSSYLPSNA